MQTLNELIYIYINTKESEKTILERHVFSTVVFVKTFPKSDKNVVNFLNEFIGIFTDIHKKQNCFKYSKLFKQLVVRFPIKKTDNFEKENLKITDIREAFKVVKKVLQFERMDNKIYIDENTDLNKVFLIERDIAHAENNKKRLEKKQTELYGDEPEIYYATQEDINKVRSDLGDAEFKYRVKHEIPLFPPYMGIHYDNEYLYETYVKPYERGKKKK
jgi:hypothetical protein